MRGGVNIGIQGRERVRDCRLTGCGLLCSCAQDAAVEDGDAVLCDSDCAGKKHSLHG